LADALHRQSRMRFTEYSRPPATSAEVDHLINDAAVGMTLAHLASQAESASPVSVRSLAAAEAALADVRRNSSRVTLPTEDAVALESTLRELATLLEALRS